MSMQVILAAVVVVVCTLIAKAVRRWRRRVQYPPGVSLAHQSVALEGDVFGSSLTAGHLLHSFDEPNIWTLYDVFTMGARKSQNGECLGWRESKRGPFVFRKYDQVLKQATQLGCAIRHLHIPAGQSTFIGIYARTCAEWFTMSLGCMTQNMITVPLYDTLGAEAATHIINQTKIGLILADDGAKISKLLQCMKETPALKYIIVLDYDSVTEELEEKANSVGVSIIPYSEFMMSGGQHAVEKVLPDANDTHIVCYTSGTTGLPKGVILTHQNYIAQLGAIVRLCNDFHLNICVGDSLISYLPLSHVFEQINHWFMLSFGGKIGYFQGDIRLLTHDIKQLQPAVFPTVPRLLNRLCDKISATIQESSAVRKVLFDFAYSRKLAYLNTGVVRNDSFWDRLVFNNISQQLGGRVKFIVTGSAPINGKVLELCKVTIGCHVIEGYGQTECTGMASCTLPGDPTGGHVGAPISSAHIRLIDIPELDYYARDGKGEVCIRGPIVTPGYYADEAKTRETIDKEGWLHTGDVGLWLPNGSLRIIDRKKHIFKLAQGEYVAPEKIENIYSQSPFVAQVYVDGDSLQRFLVAVVVPDEECCTKWYKEVNPGVSKSFAHMCAEQSVNAAVLADMQKIGKAANLNSIEQVKAVHLDPNLWTTESDLLTPTQKAKRPALRKYYSKQIEHLYKMNADA